MSVINMKSFMIICVFLLLDHHGTGGITTHSVTGCLDRFNLSCPNVTMMHVERITYYNTTDCNQALTDQQVCGQPFTGSDTGLIPVCNGKKSCSEILYNTTCPGSKAARIDYRCVEGDKGKDICDQTIIENTNRIFLLTPNYPSPPTFTNISPCRCNIRGSNITSIEIVELNLKTSDDGTKSSLEINYGDVTYRTESLTNATRRVYNKRLTSTSTTAEIILNHNNINKQILWIEIQGVSMRVSCNYGTKSTSTVTSTSSSKSLTTSTSSSPSSTTLTSASLYSPTSISSSPSSTTLIAPSLTTPASTSSSLTVTLSSSSSSSTTTSFSTTSISTSSSSTVTLSSSSSQSASTESNTPEEPPFKSPTTDSSSKIQVIAGSVVGGVILIVIVIIIIIFICRKRSQNLSSTTKPDMEIIDVNPDYISMDYQRIHRGQADGGEIDDDLTKADNDTDLNEVIESDKSGQTASKSNMHVVYAEVNKPGRKSLGGESNSVAPNFTLGDDKVSSDKTQESDGTRSQEDSSDGPVYSVVNKAKNKRNSLEADDKSPEIIITENELYVPFGDEVSDRIVMENDLYVPMEDTLLTKVL